MATTVPFLRPAPAYHVEVDDRPIRPRTYGADDAIALVGSIVSSASLAWLVYYRLSPLEGGLGFGLVWYALFLSTYYLVSRDRLGKLAAKDRIAAVVVATAGVGLTVALVLIVGYTFVKGVPALRPNFFVDDQATTASLSAATEGGGAHAIVGTLEQVAIAALLSVPLGVTTALFLNEVGGRLARPVRMIVDAMSAIPSIVAGLFVFAVFIIQLGGQQSGLAAGLALAVLMLPTVTRTTEVVLRLVPGGLREGALALGSTEWKMVSRVVLPTARSGVVTAVVLGVARIVGETAPLILTAGGAFTMKWNPIEGAQDALPYFVYRLVNFPIEAQKQRAWTGALVLIAIVLVLFVLARWIGSRTPGSTTRRRERRGPRRNGAPS